MKPGEIIRNRYKIQRLLGQGSMGATYQARDLEQHGLVAIKQLHLARVQEWKSLEMFEREAKILQQLSHSRIPRYIDYFSRETAEGLQFLLVQEYVEGKTLKQMIEDGWRGSEPEILDIFFDLVDILVALHSVCPPVIHRDINPKNIIISPNQALSPVVNDVYLVDFGAVQDKIRTTVLGGTTVVGTFGYVPFEQFSGRAVPASDYYALGATLLYMLTHRHPSEFPSEDFKPQFEPFLQTSTSITQLLNGLLEPSAQKRTASLEHLRDMFHDVSFEATYSPASRLKPEHTSIEKLSEKPYHCSFRIPKQKIGIVLKRTVFSLTPKYFQAREEILGVNSGNLWSVPTAGIQAADLTRYFEKGTREKQSNSVLGLNFGGQTLEIASHLRREEIEWLSEEITDYLWIIQHEMPQAAQKDEEAQEERATQALKETPRPVSCKIKKMAKKTGDLRFRLPNALNLTELADIAVTFLVSLACAVVLSVGAMYLIVTNSLGWFFGGFVGLLSCIFWSMGLGLFCTGMARILGRTTIYLTPEWIRIRRRCLGIGYSLHIPTAALQPGDVIRYFHKNTLLLGLNYDGKTCGVGAGLTQAEIDWLIEEINLFIVSFARPIPHKMFEADLEMK